jgi:hypothetical protein
MFNLQNAIICLSSPLNSISIRLQPTNCTFLVYLYMQFSVISGVRDATLQTCIYSHV